MLVSGSALVVEPLAAELRERVEPEAVVPVSRASVTVTLAPELDLAEAAVAPPELSDRAVQALEAC